MGAGCPKMSSCQKTLIFIVILTWMCLVRAECDDDPPSIANAVNNITGCPPFTAGTLVRFDCNIGYNPTGTSRFYTCNGTEWIGGPFQCETIYCSRIERPENGQIINQPTNEVGTVIKFACNEGYDMSSSDSMLCRADSNWSPASPPTCTARDCGEFGSIRYASLFQDSSNAERNHFGSVVEVTCLDGRALNGPPRVECKANGQWGQRPTCELLQCPPYPNANASCISNSQLLGSFYFILCREHISTRTGPDAAECIEGAWDSLEMACYCDCSISNINTDVISVSGLNSYGNLPHEASLEWTCHHGSSSSQVDYVVCTDGILRAMKNEEEVISVNTITTSDINLDVLSPKLCNLPTTNTVQTKDTVQTNDPVQTKDPVQTNDPVQTKDPVQTIDPVRTKDPVHTTDPVPNSSNTKKDSLNSGTSSISTIVFIFRNFIIFSIATYLFLD